MRYFIPRFTMPLKYFDLGLFDFIGLIVRKEQFVKHIARTTMCIHEHNAVYEGVVELEQEGVTVI